MGLDQAVTVEPPPPILFAGVGFRAGTRADEIAGLIARALAEAGALPAALAAIATAADRAGEPAVHAAAAAYGLTPLPLDGAALAACDGRVPTRSPRIERTRGVGSLAEAAALAAAGPGSRIALARIASAGATCALAAAPERATDESVVGRR